MLIKSRAFYRKAKCAFLVMGINLVSTAALADDLPAVQGAASWVTKTFISVAFTILGLQIMFRLWQINQGQKEWSEVVKPVLVTAAIAATPAIVTALVSVMR